MFRGIGRRCFIVVGHGGGSGSAIWAWSQHAPLPPPKKPLGFRASFAPGARARIAGRERAGTGSCFTTYPVHVDEVDNGDKLAIEGIRGEVHERHAAQFDVAPVERKDGATVSGMTDRRTRWGARRRWIRRRADARWAGGMEPITHSERHLDVPLRDASTRAAKENAAAGLRDPKTQKTRAVDVKIYAGQAPTNGKTNP